MNANKLYQVSEFADMAGVTVRTLQYYDRIGVLEPSDKTDAQHRLYARKDLLKLQQVLTLKQLGFTLKEIKQMIHRPGYDLRSALQAQKQAIDAQIAQLQEVSGAMEQAMDVLDATDRWDWDTVQFIIQGMTDQSYLDWIRQYFSDEQLATFAQQSQEMSLEALQTAQLQWQDIASTLRRNQHLPPEHPMLQSIARQADALIQAFTRGDMEVERSLKKMYSQPEQIPPAYKVFDDELLPLYRQVLDIYYRNKRQKNENCDS